MTILGNVLDRQFGTDPALTLVFLVLGLLVGFVGAYRQLQSVLSRIAREQERKGR